MFNNDIVIPNGVSQTFFDAEYLFAPNVKITVKPGGSLVFYGCHLYGCSDMWQGIVVEDGGRVQIAGNTGTHDALFEDAIVGIDASNQFTTTITPPPTGNGIVEIDRVIFNKNYIAIRINNYKRNFTNYPFQIWNSKTNVTKYVTPIPSTTKTLDIPKYPDGTPFTYWHFSKQKEKQLGLSSPEKNSDSLLYRIWVTNPAGTQNQPHALIEIKYDSSKWTAQLILMM